MALAGDVPRDHLSAMSWLWRIAEREIERARDAGDLKGLAGEGKPLPADSGEAGLDPVEAAGFRLMKKEGAAPPEVTLRRKAAEQRARLASLTDPEERKAAMAECAETAMKLAILSERRRGLRW